METLGNEACAPIGDCDAAFPPANATMFVNRAYTDDQIDSAHVRTITDAVNRAAAGATIAVAKGTYTESIRVRTPVSIVGKCARDVVVVSPNGTTAGVEAGAKNVGVKGLTLRGHRGGVVTVLGGSATVDSCLVDKSILAGLVASTGALTAVRTRVIDTTEDPTGLGGMGVLVQKGTAIIQDSSIVHNQEAGIGVFFGAGKAHVSRSIIRDTTYSKKTGGAAGVATIDGGSVEITESAIVNVASNAVEITARCSGSVTRSVIRNVKPNARGVHGHGLAVGAKGKGILENSTIADTASSAIIVVDPDTALLAKNSVIVGHGKGNGIIASAGAKADLEGTAIVDVTDVGLLAQDAASAVVAKHSLIKGVGVSLNDERYGYGAGAILGAEIALDDTAILNVSNAGLVGDNSTITSTDIVIRGTRANANGDYGRGVQATGGAAITIDHSIIVDQEESGLVSGDERSGIAVSNTVIAWSGRKSQIGHGVVGLERGRIAIANSLLHDNGGAALAFSGATARVDDVLVTRNSIGIFVSGQDFREVEILPNEEAVGVVLVRNGKFVDNLTRISADRIPLPQIIKIEKKQ